MKRSESIKEIGTALAKAQGMMEHAKKDVSNTFFKAKYSDLASVVEAIKKPFSDNGLSYAQFTLSSDKNEVGVETLLIHSSGEWLLSDPLFIPVSKNDAQAYGSAISYAKRYSLQAISGTPSDDDDGNAASGKKDNAFTEPEEISEQHITLKDAKNVGDLVKAMNALTTQEKKANKSYFDSRRKELTEAA